MNTEEYNQLIDYISNPNQPHVPRSVRNQAEHYEIFDKRLYRKYHDKLLLVVKPTEVENILYLAHEHPLGGHFGIEKTFQKITEHYWWPKLGKSVQHYVKTCETCQRLLPPTRSEPLQPIPPIGIMKKWGIDLVGPMERTPSGNLFMIVAIDYLTKWPEAKAIPDKRAETIATFIVDDIICRHGIPEEIVTDHGTEFDNQLMKYIARRVGIKRILATTYHPQANGQVERMNQTLVNTLRKLTDKKPNLWDEYMATALFAYRTTQQSTTGYTPFQLLHGYEAVTPLTRNLKQIGTENELKRRLGQLVEVFSKRVQARENIRARQITQKKYYDRNLKEKPYQPGEKVWIDKETLNMLRRKKTNLRLTGPFEIVRRNKNGTYYIKDKNGKVLKKAYSGDKLRRYEIRRQWGEPVVEIQPIEGIHTGREFPRLVNEGEEEYIVLSILQ